MLKLMRKCVGLPIEVYDQMYVSIDYMYEVFEDFAKAFVTV